MRSFVEDKSLSRYLFAEKLLTQLGLIEPTDRTR